MLTLSPSPQKRDESIQVRRMDLEFPDSMPTFWFDDNPLLTAVLSSLAVSFPPGERYFIDSVRHFQPAIEDAALRKAIFAFIGQEMNHTREHVAFNAFLDQRGFPATALEQWVRRRLTKLQRHSTPEANLARTVALEHFTAILAASLLGHPEELETMSPEAAQLWAWHAIEEIEHRSVAFDVYQAAVGDEALRIRVMIQVSIVFVLVNCVRTAILLRASERRLDARSVAKALNVLLGRPGMFRKVLPRYLEYYRRDFHPSQHDDQAVVDAAKRRFLGDRA